MTLLFVVGARPNFIKVSALLAAARRRKRVVARLVHTGQHYDEQMSRVFFRELELPEPDDYLGVGSGSHAQQTARVMLGFDEVLEHRTTDVVLVVGDVNSTLACALVAAKRGVCVAHVEAGLRSGDRTMPEELNRILTDQLSDYLFTTERSASDQLASEGIPSSRVHFVGNVMIDALFRHRERASASALLERLQLTPRGYGVCTLHRPSNVDSPEAAENTLEAIAGAARRRSLVVPLHPRTRSRWEQFGLLGRLHDTAGVHVIEPLGYLDFLGLLDSSRFVLTDSGGIQEETTALGVPCLTFRQSTERPITITHGTNHLVGTNPAAVVSNLDHVLAAPMPVGRVPEFWDGNAAERILDVLCRDFPAPP